MRYPENNIKCFQVIPGLSIFFFVFFFFFRILNNSLAKQLLMLIQRRFDGSELLARLLCLFDIAPGLSLVSSM